MKYKIWVYKTNKHPRYPWCLRLRKIDSNGRESTAVVDYFVSWWTAMNRGEHVLKERREGR